MEDLRQGYGGERGLQTKAGSEVRKWRADQLERGCMPGCPTCLRFQWPPQMFVFSLFPRASSKRDLGTPDADTRLVSTASWFPTPNG